MKRLIKFLLDIFRFSTYEFSKNRFLGLRYIGSTWPHGFLSVSYLIYNLRSNNKENYLSDWKRLHLTSKLNGNKKTVLDDKLIFHLMNINNANVLSLVAVIGKGRILNYSEESHCLLTTTAFLNSLDRYRNGVIMKPNTGGGGAGISKIRNVDGKIEFTGACKNAAAFEAAINSGKEYIITEIIRQSGNSAQVYPRSINSIRILTMIDPIDYTPFIAAAVHRFGVQSSGLVDNWSAGGISVKIDHKSGILGFGAKYPAGPAIEWFSSHPETGVEFKDMRVDNWDAISAAVLKMAQKYHYLPYVGWDIVPMAEGFYFLEGNNNSDVNLLQIHTGLLEDQQIKRFYNYHKII